MRMIFRKIKMANALSAMALLFAVIGVNTKCVYIFHQPELNDKVKQLKKY